MKLRRENLTLIPLAEFFRKSNATLKSVKGEKACVITKDELPKYLIIDVGAVVQMTEAEDEEILQASARLLRENMEVYHTLTKEAESHRKRTR